MRYTSKKSNEDLESYYRCTQIITREQKPWWAWPWSNKVHLEKDSPLKPCIFSMAGTGIQENEKCKLPQIRKTTQCMGWGKESWKEYHVRHSSSWETLSRPALHDHSVLMAWLIGAGEHRSLGLRGEIKQRWSLRTGLSGSQSQKECKGWRPGLS